VSDNTGKSRSDYLVGYGRPPKATRFKPGQSGNPKGRPTGRRSIGTILQDIIQQRVQVTKAGKTCWMPTLEAMLRLVAAEAMRKEQWAIKLVLTMADQYQELPEVARQFQETLSEDQEILAQYLPGYRAETGSTETIDQPDDHHGGGV
jgi:hypothetical protein